MPGWTDSITASLDSAEKFTDRLDPIGNDVALGVADARVLIGDAGEMLGDNRAKVDRIVDNVEQATRAVNEEWVPLGTETMTAARDGALIGAGWTVARAEDYSDTLQ